MEEDHARRALNPRIFKGLSAFASLTIVRSLLNFAMLDRLKTSFLSKKNKRYGGHKR